MLRRVPVRLLAVLALSTPMQSVVAAPNQSVVAAPNLCHGDETVVFSCQTRKGIASLCRAPEGSGPQLQYRFGVAGHIALIYPQNDAAPRDAFLADTLMYSGGGGAYIQFTTHDALRYTIFTAIGRWGEGGTPRETAGVAVSKADKEVANLACVGTTTSELGAALFTALGLKPSEDGFDIPDAFTGN